jgi:hypothetical protein
VPPARKSSEGRCRKSARGEQRDAYARFGRTVDQRRKRQHGEARGQSQHRDGPQQAESLGKHEPGEDDTADGQRGDFDQDSAGERRFTAAGDHANGEQGAADQCHVMATVPFVLAMRPDRLVAR